jgi:hypothetical protein
MRDSSLQYQQTYEQMSYTQLYFSLQLAFSQIEKLNTQQILMNEQLRTVLQEKATLQARVAMLE